MQPEGAATVTPYPCMQSCSRIKAAHAMSAMCNATIACYKPTWGPVCMSVAGTHGFDKPGV
jgi:hypothetical protein